MPRRAKTTQPNRTIPGQTYGVGGEQERAMKVVPLDNAPARREQAAQAAAQIPTAPPSAPTTEGAAPFGGAAPLPLDFTTALDAARMMAPPTGEINVAGAAAPGISPQESLWSQLAVVTGDPTYLRIAQQARLTR